MAENDPSKEPRPRGPSLLGRVLVAVFMGSVVGAECLFAYFWLPSADEVAVRAEQIAKQAKNETAADQGDKEREGIPEVEMDLGKFTITNHRLDSEATFRLDFHLFGTVVERDQSEFAKVFKRNEHRFRDHVIVQIRKSEVDDLTSAGLGLIKRRILEKSNALFGKPLLRSVVFAEYSFVEL